MAAPAFDLSSATPDDQSAAPVQTVPAHVPTQAAFDLSSATADDGSSPVGVPTSTSSSTGQNILDYVTGKTFGEPILHMASGAVGGIAGDLAGLESAASNRMADSDNPIVKGLGSVGQSVVSYITGSNNPDDVKSTVANALTYEPKSASGKAVQSGVDTVLSPVGTAINYGEGKLGDLASGTAGMLGASPAAQADIKSGTQDVGDLALSLIPADKLIGGAASGVAKTANKFAENRAFAALGGQKNVLNNVSGADPIASARAAGRYALDNNVISANPLKAGNVDYMNTQNAALNKAAGQAQGAAVAGGQSIIDKINAVSPESGVSIGQPDAQDLASSIKNKYASTLRGSEFSTGATRSALQEVINYLENRNPDTVIPGHPGSSGTPDLRTPTDMDAISPNPGEGVMVGSGNPPIPATPETVVPGDLTANNGNPHTLQNLQDFKNKLKENTDFNSDQAGSQVREDIWHMLDNRIGSGLKSASAQGSALSKYPQFDIDPDALSNYYQDWKNAKTQYQNSKNTELALENKAKGEAGKKVSSFGNLMASLVGFAGGGVPGVIGAVTAKEAIQRFGNPYLALGADALSKGADKLSNITPAGAVAAQTAGTQGANTEQRDEVTTGVPTLQSLFKQNPRAFGKYAIPLQEAASRGDDHLAATMYVLGTSDPNYRAITNGLLDNYNATQQ